MKTEFDEFADDYESALNQGLAYSGEDKNYFASGRIGITQQYCLTRQIEVAKAMDFGCGTGESVSLLAQTFHTKDVVGFEVSEKSLGVARKHHSDYRFRSSLNGENEMSFDLVYCNGVFHHIPVPERSDALKTIFHHLRPGGLFAFWENNPFNPGTRFVMSRIPFDKDAILLKPSEARRICREAGFVKLTTRYHFIFPRLFKLLRFSERFFSQLPIGAQFVVFAQKPSTGSSN